MRVAIAENKTLDSLYAVTQRGEEKPLKYYQFGNNQHIEIIENIETGKLKGRVVTAMEAARRARRARIPIVRRDCEEGWRFVMSLSINDMVNLDAQEKGCDLYRVQKISGTGQMQMMLRAHTGAFDDATCLLKNPNTLRGCKMSVDPLGKLEAAHD